MTGLEFELKANLNVWPQGSEFRGVSFKHTSLGHFQYFLQGYVTACGFYRLCGNKCEYTWFLTSILWLIKGFGSYLLIQKEEIYNYTIEGWFEIIPGFSYPLTMQNPNP